MKLTYELLNNDQNHLNYQLFLSETCLLLYFFIISLFLNNFKIIHFNNFKFIFNNLNSSISLSNS